MAMSRADALRRLSGLAPQVEAHLAKIAQNPVHSSIVHWTRELNSWFMQMEAVLPHIGTRTAATWAARIAAWKSAMGE
jgi:hypothetical protein